jgi:GNAT superfamily N-acetyltransferase
LRDLCGTGPQKAFASAGDYFVSLPSLGDTLRLRELERGFVFDHCSMFHQEAWHAKMRPTDWCSFVGAIEQDEKAVQAIASIITGNLPGHLTLKCVHAPTGNASSKTVGYIHITCLDGMPWVAHLKVDEKHRGQRLGSLLFAGAARAINRLGVVADGMRLTVLAKNAPALALYQRVGFCEQKSVTTVGSMASVEWKTLVRSLRTKLSWSVFAELCEARVRTTRTQ